MALMGQRIQKALAMSHAALIATGFIGGLSAAKTEMAWGLTFGAIAQPTPSERDNHIPSTSDLAVESTSSPESALNQISPPSPDRTSEQLQPESSSSSPPTQPNRTSLTPVDLSNVKPEFSVSGNGSAEDGNTYIDTTDYSLGATQAPSSVILTERSTGCSTVIQQGDTLPRSMCGMNAASAETYSGSYPGGTEPNSPNAVQVGPLSIDSNGIRLVRSLNIRDYYNRTMRPESFAGNGDRQLMFPLSMPAMISSPFGWRVHPIFGRTRFHTGTDLAAPMGTPVVATYSGRVTVADFVGGYGLTVVLRHDDQSIETLYGHLSEIFVQPGETIQQGDVIGRVGSTGNSTGPHLHFEVRKPTDNGWVAINTGELLQAALGRVSNDLQLASAQVDEGDLLALNIPEFLQLGKDATKDK